MTMALRLPKPSKERLANDPYLRYGSLGVQFGATILLFTLGGLWLDGKFGTRPWLTIVGVMLGFTGGLLALIRGVPPARGSAPDSEAPLDTE